MRMSYESKNIVPNCITHAGTFHADEVMATVILDEALPYPLVLSRVSKVPEDVGHNTIVYDIGYGEFDHHQKEGAGKREWNGVPYAACGLIWARYGTDAIQARLANKYRDDVMSGQDIKRIWDIVDRDLIQGIDAADTGNLPRLDYAAQPLTFSGIISRMNPDWDSVQDSDEAFWDAFLFASQVFDTVIDRAISQVMARSTVIDTLMKSEGNIMVMDQFMPWIDVVLDLSQDTSTPEGKKASQLLYGVYPGKRGDYQWRVVPTEPGSFNQRNLCPPEWRGLKGDELRKACGIDTATFVHPNGFIGGAETKLDAVKMANRLIERGERAIK